MLTNVMMANRDVPFGLDEVLVSVPVSLSQVAEWTGITRRQLSYWIRQGLIPTEDRISVATVEQAALIKAELGRNLTLRRAAAKVAALVDLAERTLAEEESAPIGELATQLQQRIDDCVGLSRATRGVLPDLDAAALERLADAIERVRIIRAKSDGVWPLGFSVVLDQLSATFASVLSGPDDAVLVRGLETSDSE